MIIWFGFYSCRPKQPDFMISKDFRFIEDRNKSIIRNVEIEQYDTKNNFVGAKYIYKNTTSEGKYKIFLFSNNEGYYYNGDSLNLQKGFTYKIYIRTLGFADSVVFRP